MQVNKADGMVSLNDALMELVTKKLVEPAEAYAKAVDKAGFDAAAEACRHQPRPADRPKSGADPHGRRTNVALSASRRERAAAASHANGARLRIGARDV